MTLSCPLYDLESENNWFVIDMTIFTLDSESTNLDKSNESKIIQIGQIEAQIFVIQIFGSKPKDWNRKKYVFSTFLLMQLLIHLGRLSLEI